MLIEELCQRSHPCIIYQTNIKVISTMYENITAAVKVGNEVSSIFCIKSGVKQSCVLSHYIWIILIDLVLRSIDKAMEDHGINGEEKLS